MKDKTQRRIGRFAKAILLSLCLAASAGCSGGRGEPIQTERYLVGAYYYLWFPKNFSHGCLRRNLIPRQVPELGFYDSMDVAVAEQHIAWCSKYGIDFLAVDWWPNRPKQNAVLPEAFLKASNIGDIKFCIFYESWSLGMNKDMGAVVFDEAKKQRFVSEIEDLADEYFNHPSYLKVDGRPVLMLYLTRTFAGLYDEALLEIRAKLRSKGLNPFIIGDEIFWKVSPTVKHGKDPFPLTDEPQRRRIRSLDAITAYNMYEIGMQSHSGYGSESKFVSEVDGIYEEYRSAAGQGVYFVPSIIPGYNDRGVRPKGGHYAIPRRWTSDAPEASFFAECFDRLAFKYMDDRLNMMLITSWNEWNEDTAIEPLHAAEATARGVGKDETHFTQGYLYEGHGRKYLDVIRDKVVAVGGRVTSDTGAPVSGKIVRAKGNGKALAARSDSRGYYRFSRLGIMPGRYELWVEGVARKVVAIPERGAVTGIDFVITGRTHKPERL